jgi:hypothetical protein
MHADGFTRPFTAIRGTEARHRLSKYPGIIYYVVTDRPAMGGQVDELVVLPPVQASGEYALRR